MEGDLIIPCSERINQWDIDSQNGATKIIVMMMSGEFDQYRSSTDAEFC